MPVSPEIIDMKKFKIFVINLNESTERLERLKSEFERIGLDFERLPAVDGRKLSDNQILKHYSPELNRKKYFVPLSKPEIGVYLSHLMACEKIISENLDFGIILEDDIVLKEGFQMIPQVLYALKHRWSYIRLIPPKDKEKVEIKTKIPLEVPVRITFERYSKNTNFYEGKKIKETKIIKLPVLFELIAWDKPPMDLPSAYAISSEGAMGFLSKQPAFSRPIDKDLLCNLETELEVMGLIPCMCSLCNAVPDIKDTKTPYSNFRGKTNP